MQMVYRYGAELLLVSMLLTMLIDYDGRGVFNRCSRNSKEQPCCSWLLDGRGEGAEILADQELRGASDGERLGTSSCCAWIPTSATSEMSALLPTAKPQVALTLPLPPLPHRSLSTCGATCHEGFLQLPLQRLLDVKSSDKSNPGKIINVSQVQELHVHSHNAWTLTPACTFVGVFHAKH